MILKYFGRNLRVNKRLYLRAKRLSAAKRVAWQVYVDAGETDAAWVVFQTKRDRLNTEYADILVTPEHCIVLSAGIYSLMKQMS